MMFKPDSEVEVADIIRNATTNKSTVEIIGGATKRAIGKPIVASIELSSRSLSGIVAYTPSEMVITAKAGTQLDHIKAALAENNQELAFDPIDYRALLSTTNDETIGAVAAANLSGPRRFVGGAARDSLLGVKFINGKGEIIKNGGRVMKNVTGLDLVKLMAGSWGTLGFLTEVTFKVLPKSQSETTLALLGLSDAEGVTALATAMKTHCEVIGAAHIPEFVNSTLLSGQLKSEGATLLRLQGSMQSLADRLLFLQRQFPTVQQLVFGAEQSLELWQQIRDCQPFHQGKPMVWRVSMAPSKGFEMVDVLRRHTGLAAFYDWQGGLIWLQMEANAEADLLRKTISATGGGHAVLIRADEQTRALTQVFQPQPAVISKLTAGIKAAFDPAGIFNPGRMD